MFENIYKTWVLTDKGKNDISPLLTGENILDKKDIRAYKGRLEGLKRILNVFFTSQ